MARREMKIGFGQVVVLWAVLALIMVLVFWFGYKTGMNRGNTLALDEGDKQAVRLPVVEPVAQKDTIPGQEFEAEPKEVPMHLVSQSALADKHLAQDKNLPLENPQNSLETDPTFDFSAVKESTQARAKDVRKEEQDSRVEAVEQPSAGLRSRSTDELLQASQSSVASSAENQAKKKNEAKKKKIADKTPKDPSLAKSAESSAVVRSGNLASGWYVQIAATLSLSEAKQIVRKFSKLGIKAIIERAEVRKRIYYRILLGTYGSQGKASEVKKDLRKQKLIRDEPFLKHVN